MAKRSLASKAVGVLIGLPFTIVAVLFALSNRHDVTLRFWPLPGSIDVPIYLAAFVVLVLGFLVGGAYVMVAEVGIWRRARRAEKSARKLDDQLQIAAREAEETRKALPSSRPSERAARLGAR